MRDLLDQVRSLRRLARRALALAGREPWFAFLISRCGLAICRVPQKSGVFAFKTACFPTRGSADDARQQLPWIVPQWKNTTSSPRSIWWMGVHEVVPVVSRCGPEFTGKGGTGKGFGTRGSPTPHGGCFSRTLLGPKRVSPVLQASREGDRGPGPGSGGRDHGAADLTPWFDAG